MAASEPGNSSRFSVAFRASLNADEVEQNCLAGVRASPDASLLDERIAGLEDDPPADSSQVERSQIESETIESMGGGAAEELKRRAEIPGYPYEFNGKSLRYLGSKTLAYEFCLAVSRASSKSEGEFARLPRNFERLTAMTARLYLGDGAKSLRTGWPTDEEDGQAHPRDFKGHVDLLRKLAPAGSGEWTLAPESDFAQTLENANDHGMDFVAWKPYPDERLGRITVLGQCACGRYDLAKDDKAKELDLVKLNILFRRVTWLNPMRLFATPYQINEPHRFKTLHAFQNLVFDRSRIASICEAHAEDSELKVLRPRIHALIKLVFGKLTRAPAAGPTPKRVQNGKRAQ